MSKFLEIPSAATSRNSFRTAILCYMLEEFRPGLYHIIRRPQDPLEGKEKELIQLLIDNSNHKLRMYGSAEELLENVDIYKDFPGNHKLFSCTNEPYPFSPKIFTGMNNEKYIAKSDVFVILQNMIFGIATPKPVEVTKMLNFYTKSREENAGFISMEFAKFDEVIFEKMQERLEEEFSKTQFLPAEYQQHIAEFSKMSKDEIFEKFKAFLPHTLDFNQNWDFENFLKTLLNFSQSEKPSTEEIVRYYMACNHPIKALGTTIDENPDMFLPIREDSDQPLTLRVFEDGDQKFLMEDEVFETDFDQNSIYLFIITMEEVLENCDIQDVEFIRYPITRTKHRATPIQGPSGNFYILAIDYFFEYLRDLIHGKKIFQRLKPADLPNFLDNLNGIFQFLYRNEDIHFIRTDTILALDDIDDRLSFSYSARDVSNVKPSGFTVQDLKNELDHLGLTKNFPEIQNYAEKVYSEVDKNKKESVLRTCDLFDAVEHCQLNCILERLPKLKKFVHSQKGCHRVYGLKCEDCTAENPENQEDQMLKILGKELEDLKMSHQKILEENQRKSLEIEELQQKNLRLSVKNETNEVKMKQLTDKLAESNLSIDYGTACTSNASQQKIQCLICEKSIESGEDQIIRCPLCKRRFHTKCAINWLKEHKECPACNENLPKF